MSSISTLRNIALPLSVGIRKPESTDAEGNKFADDFTSLKGFGEHFLYLITFGQVHKGKERQERFMNTIGEMLESPRSKDDYHDLDDTIVCTFRDPTSNVNRIRVEIRHDEINMETFNEYTGASVAHFHLDAQIEIGNSGEAVKRKLIKTHIEHCIDSNSGSLCRNLWGQDLSGIDFRTLNMSHKNLSHADLSDSNLYKADLSGTFLEGADLKGADLRRAILPDLSLDGVDLWGAKISQKNLDWAAARGALIEGAIICEE